MLNLVHFPAIHPYITHLQTHAAFADWNFTPYTSVEELAQKAEVFILFSHFEVQEKYIAPDHIWKKYLQQYCPQLKFLNLSIYPSEHPNHLFLFDLPTNLFEKVNRARALNEDWEPFVFGAMDARCRLQDFLAGHGTMSFYKPLYRLQSILKDIYAEYQNGVPYAEIWADLGSDVLFWWEALHTRFQQYQDFFAILPIISEIESIRAKLGQVMPFFTGKGNNEQLLYDLNCLEALESIEDTLKILQDYAAH